MLCYYGTFLRILKYLYHFAGKKSTLGKKAVCTKGEAAFERFLFAQTVNQLIKWQELQGKFALDHFRLEMTR